MEPESLAVCLLHAYQNPVHERRIRDIALALRPTLKVSLSSEIMPEYREYERASTTVMNAYLAPVVDAYLGRLQHVAGQKPLLLALKSGNFGAPDFFLKAFAQ